MTLRTDATRIGAVALAVCLSGGCRERGLLPITPPGSRPPPRRATEPAPAPTPSAAQPAQPAPSDPVTPVAATAAEAGESPLRLLYRRAAAAAADYDSYIVRLQRREIITGSDGKHEVIVLKFRRRPLSVHMKWVGEEAKGREIVYVQGRYDDKIHILMNSGLLAGRRMAFAPDSPMVRARSRYPVNEAGVAAAVERFGRALAAVEQGRPGAGTMRYLGPQRRPEIDGPVYLVEQTVPPGQEEHLARGGRRLIGFHGDNGLPVLMQTWDDRNQEVEFYVYDRWQRVRLDDADFDPDVLWSKPSAGR